MSAIADSLPRTMRASASLVDRALAERLADNDWPGRLREAMAYAVLGKGKRLRPVLVLWGAECLGGSPESAIPAACAVEMVHAYSLIHDDLPAMDDDDLRRGRPTVHRQFDEATAILAGDALQSLAFETLGQITPGAIAARCVVELARAIGPAGMAGGQMDDLLADGAGDVDGLESMHARKTGALLVASLRMGGIIAQASDEDLSRLTVFGHALGLAFQIVDDLLDVEGNVERVGKNVRKDIGAGKLTYPSLLGIDESRRIAEQWITRAREALSPFGARAERLMQLAQYVVERDS